MTKKIHNPYSIEEYFDLEPEELLKHPLVAEMGIFLKQVWHSLMEIEKKDKQALMEYIEFAKGSKKNISTHTKKLIMQYEVCGFPLINEDCSIHKDFRVIFKKIAHIDKDEVHIRPPISIFNVRNKKHMH